MGSVFSKERVNTGRQLEFDLAKAVTIILMIWTHIYEDMSTGFAPSISSFNAYVRGSLAGAVTFMFCMGIGVSYTRHNSAKECISRGVRLLTTGFVLELFREVIPTLVRCIRAHGTGPGVYLVLGLGSDILQFAGLAFLLVGVLKKLNVGNLAMLFISIGLSAVGTLLEGVSTGFYPADQLFGFFWGTYSESYFPLFNWFIFVAAGQYFGDKYQYLQDKNKFHAISLLIGAAVCAAYIYVSFNVDQNILRGLTGERYLAHRPIADALLCIPVNIGMISLFYFIGLAIPVRAVPVLVHPSRHINQYYCISWVVIVFSHLAIHYPRLSSDAGVIVAWLAVLAVTTAIVIVYSRFLKNGMESFFGKHRTFWSVLVWAICIVSFIWAVCTFDSYPNFLNGYSA